MKKNTLFLFIFCSINFLFSQKDKANAAFTKTQKIQGEIIEILTDYKDYMSENRKKVAMDNLKDIDLFQIKINPLLDGDGNPANDKDLTDETQPVYEEILQNYEKFNADISLWITKEREDKKILDELHQRIDTMERRITKDIYNPINFTTILHRMPTDNGADTGINFSNLSSRNFIKKEGTLHLKFDPEFVKKLTYTNKLNLKVNAFIERKDKTVKPVEVLGLTDIIFELISNKETFGSTEFKNNDQDDNIIEDKYQIKYKTSTSQTTSAEIAIPFEEVSNDDTIIIEITNQAVSGVGFISKFVFAEYGWSSEPTGGFSFVQTLDGDDNIFRAAGSTGYAFKYTFSPSNNFWHNFLMPSFGPELNVLQVQNEIEGQTQTETLIGIGAFIATFSKTVKFGLGAYLNGESNKVYFSLGLNFIEGYNSIKELVEKTK